MDGRATLAPVGGPDLTPNPSPSANPSPSPNTRTLTRTPVPSTRWEGPISLGLYLPESTQEKVLTPYYLQLWPSP